MIISVQPLQTDKADGLLMEQPVGFSYSFSFAQQRHPSGCLSVLILFPVLSV